MNDYHAFKSTSGGNGGGSGGGSGCSKVFFWILLIYGLIKLLGSLG